MNEKINKMSVKNIAIVISPNLFIPNTDNPMAALTKAQKVTIYNLVIFHNIYISFILY